MADRAKRARVAVVAPAAPKAAAVKPPPARFLGRSCRVRLVGNSEWVKGTLQAYSGPNKQVCEVEVEDGDGRRPLKVDLATQPLHVLEEVVWSPETGDGAAARGVLGRGSDAKGELGVYVDGLVPALLFSPLGPKESEAEDGHVLAQSLVSDDYLWVRREFTRPLAAHMFRRRTSEKVKKALDAALEQDVLLAKGAAKNAKKSIVGKRIAVFWPMDDAWYFGVVQAWDPKANEHSVLYDDGVTESISLQKEAVRIFQHEGKHGDRFPSVHGQLPCAQELTHALAGTYPSPTRLFLVHRR